MAIKFKPVEDMLENRTITEDGVIEDGKDLSRRAIRNRAGSIMRQLRKCNDRLPSTKLADSSGINASDISKFENGKRVMSLYAREALLGKLMGRRAPELRATIEDLLSQTSARDATPSHALSQVVALHLHDAGIPLSSVKSLTPGRCGKYRLELEDGDEAILTVSVKRQAKKKSKAKRR